MLIRPLHWVFNVGNRQEEVDFFKNILGMEILQHHEYVKQTGKESLRTSRTLMGYGPQMTRFAIQLHYTYGISEYESGNDYLGITILSKSAIAKAKALNWPIEKLAPKLFRIYSPQGFTFHLMNEPMMSTECDPIAEVCLRTSHLTKTIMYWQSVFGAEIFFQDEDQVTFSFGKDKCKIRFVEWFLEPVERESGHGHIAFSLPKKHLELLEYDSLEKNRKMSVHHSIVEPGYLTSCKVLVFLDPDDHKLLFVEEEAYAPTVVTDPTARNAFDLSIQWEARNENEEVRTECAEYYD